MSTPRSIPFGLSMTLSLLLPVVLPGTASAACDPDGRQASGAVYRICMPEPGRWNGSLILWAHGYVAFNRPVAIPEDQLMLPDGTSIPGIINGLGYAFATTSYRVNGIAVPEGLADIVDLVDVFQAQKGPARRTYVVGGSEGGLITTLAVEQRPDLFAGGLATCGPIGDFNRQIGYVGDFRAVFDYFFPGLIPGNPVDVPPDLIANWATYYAGVVVPTVFAPANQTRLRELIRVTGAPFDANDFNATAERSIRDALFFNVVGNNDLIDKIGGQAFDNRRRLYLGSSNDLRLNLRVRRIAGEAAAQAVVRARYDTSGALSRPLVTLHTLRDQQVPAWHETLYILKAIAAGSVDKLVAIPIDRYGHCNFTAPEVLVAFGVLIFRTEHRILLPQIQALMPPASRAELEGLARQQGLVR